MPILSDQYVKHNSRLIDLLKLVLAILVVGIHTTPMGFGCRPLFRVGVPLFFMISSYLFFLKQGTCATALERRKKLVRSVRRIMKLYLFWFVILLPVTLRIRFFSKQQDFDIWVDGVQRFFFDSTFLGSWYLMALVIGIATVWFLNEKRVHDIWILALGVLMYVLCCMTSVYRPLVANIPWLAQVLIPFETAIVCPHNSFAAGILFVATGKLLAQRSFHIPNAVLIVMTLVLIVLLYGEHFFVKSLCEVTSDDCYLMLPPLCLCLLVLVGQNTKLKLNFDTRPLRACSTIVYCSHISVAYCLNIVFNRFVEKESAIYYVLLFSATLSLALLLSYVLLRLEKRDSLHWLRFSH